MTRTQMDQMLTETKLTLDGAARSRFRATGGSDLGLMWALDYFGGDLELAAANHDAQTWSRAMQALRNLVAQQQRH